jgi:hypothetical protein
LTLSNFAGDLEITKISRKFGPEVPFIHPKNLGTDSTGFAGVALHRIKELKKIRLYF